ncbi:MAG TPA: ABC transporter permease, partial [Cyclobacteriaceae bacterium]|nr:ABC transporter permease [Cyclobacteriaceae bacterium]
MLQHYLLIAFRAFKKNRGYSLLNIFGLTLGITCSLAIFLYVYDELNYDHNHTNRDRIYRLNDAYHLPNNTGFEEYATSGPVVSQVLVKDFPEIQKAVRINIRSNIVFENPETREPMYENVFGVDSNFFEIFTFPFISGNPDNALNDINTLVISKKIALKYFNRTDVVGEGLRLQNDTVGFRIAGVMEDAPANSHVKPEIITSMETLRARGSVYLETWWSFGYNTYLLLAPNTNVAELEKKIKFISRNYIADQEDKSGYKQEFSLTPFTKIHLYSNLRGELEPNSKASYVYTFLIVGIFILIIACINFMNMATARSAMRAKEIGLRKVAGAIRRQLVAQFLGEAFFMTLIAVALSIVLLYLVLPVINDFSGKDLRVITGSNFWLMLAGVTLFVALLAGSYPSLFLSAFRPVETLKGSFRNSAKGNGLRKALVVFQFGISIFLVAGTLIIMKHLDYIRSIDLGFDKSQVLIIPARNSHNGAANFKLLKEELLKISGVEKATLSSSVPGKEMNNNVVRKGWDQDAAWSDMRYAAVDYDFVDVFDLKLAEGRSFRKESPSDENEAFMVNEAGMRRLGYANPKDIIGEHLAWQNRKGTVIGVLKDFHFMGANVAIEPFIVVM